MLRECLNYSEYDNTFSSGEVVVIPKVVGKEVLLLFRKGVLKDAITIRKGKIIHLDIEIFNSIFAYSILQSSFVLDTRLREIVGNKLVAVEATVTIKKSVPDVDGAVIEKVLFGKDAKQAPVCQLIVYDIYFYQKKKLLPILPSREQYSDIAALAMLYIPLRNNVGYGVQKYRVPAKLLQKQQNRMLQTLQRAYCNLRITSLLVMRNETSGHKYEVLI